MCTASYMGKILYLMILRDEKKSQKILKILLHRFSGAKKEFFCTGWSQKQKKDCFSPDGNITFRVVFKSQFCCSFW